MSLHEVMRFIRLYQIEHKMDGESDKSLPCTIFGVQVFIIQCMNIGLYQKYFQRKNVIIFLPINFNICFGCLKEPSH